MIQSCQQVNEDQDLDTSRASMANKDVNICLYLSDRRAGRR